MRYQRLTKLLNVKYKHSIQLQYHNPGLDGMPKSWNGPFLVFFLLF
ncbi:hypothetical protein OROGR_017935 [Orobanche gracilis]